ncbi:hypothetical protein TOPH_01792 [Tolypocladium ophioglossoides CBS 100239]|uniref:Uncharacterized protein n=1 Tax=Tolypocladium ophioglossoides (strain CBS 100239) TaxID=1163406 RepID=A0A0L0NIN0_TOLOC|nr:hypothetical protein TOPH_01792 [Tolypocladium ophioglossoides CBS 100239]
MDIDRHSHPPRPLDGKQDRQDPHQHRLADTPSIQGATNDSLSQTPAIVQIANVSSPPAIRGTDVAGFHHR